MTQNPWESDLVSYRLQRSYETLEDAQVLAVASRWNACVNRLYYACFYAVSALLTRHGLSSTKHTGVRALFNQHFVKPGLVQKELAQVFNDLFERRQESDYADFISFEEASVRSWLDQAAVFVAFIANLTVQGE